MFLLNSSNQDFPYLCYAHEEGLPKRKDEREEVNGYEKSNDSPTPTFLSRTRTTLTEQASFVLRDLHANKINNRKRTA